MKRWLLCSAMLALAACGQAEEPSVETEKSEDAPGDAASPSDQDRPLADPAPDGVTARARLTAIPTEFRGVWDYAQGSCQPESDLRMEIEGGMITFYESMGRVTSVEREGTDEVLVALAMEGEGESWDSTLRLTLDGGDGLTATPVGDKPDQYDNRKRCPA